MKSAKRLTIVITISLFTSLVLAQEGKTSKDLTEEAVTTQHELLINNTALRYTATAGTILLRDKKQNPTASIFYVAYTLGNSDSIRPITFSFNGGPGSSSVWLHLGILGPQRVKMGEKGELLPPPYQLVDNIYSVLPNTDLVFIDPVGTGFSVSADTIPEETFYGIDDDIQSIAEFIRYIYLKIIALILQN
ncbi:MULTISPECIES: S10 family serine carboxypeptidase-like protein [unclassified Carboxylicivirga]|uniref:S10 family serine carboxypeptidase-like protein n=1 Tax=Carboxylicivirga TaxID=1628153 RepID=UPI003D353572